MVRVTWCIGGQERHKLVSPVALVCIQKLWSISELRSDDESDTGTEVAIFLPKLSIDTSSSQIKNLLQVKKQLLQTALREANQLGQCVYVDR